MFERFYRPDFSRNRNKGGSGLGLAIAKSLCQDLNYSIDVDLKENKIIVMRVIINKAK